MAQNDSGALEHGIIQWRISPDQEKHLVGMQQPRRHGKITPPAAESNPSMARSRQRPHRSRSQSNWAVGGPGMQAIFLGSNPTTSGTGVFLPRRQGSGDVQFSNKPALSPVLLPSRIVQTLKLNVHEVGKLVNNPRTDRLNNVAKKNEKSEKNKKVDDVVYCSPEIYLPKEWVY